MSSISGMASSPFISGATSSSPSCSFFSDGMLGGLEVVPLVEAVLEEVPLEVAIGSSDRRREVHVVSWFCLALPCSG